MDSDSENESIEGDLNDESNQQQQQKGGKETANWGKAKFDYYFTDYVDKDYPSSLSRKEEKLASIEQEEAQRIQKKLFSNLDDINLQPVIDYDIDSGAETDAVSASKKADDEDVIQFLERRNRSILETKPLKKGGSNTLDKKKNVRFDIDEIGSDECEFNSDDDDDDDDDVEGEGDEDDGAEGDDDDEEVQIAKKEPADGRKRRPINMAIKKNRGLTPYKKKEYRNPRVKHKLKYKKVMTKRRKLVKEAQTEFYRYSGETTGIKTSTVKSIKLC